MKATCNPLRRNACTLAVSLALVTSFGAAWAEELTVLHIGDQESWLLSAQGNLRNDPSQAISFYGGVDRLASVIAARKAAAVAAGGTAIVLNAGDSFLPGPRLTASFTNLATAAPDGGQDFYDAIANRAIGIDATTFGNHEFDLDNTGPVAARFAEVSGTKYLSVNLDFSVTTPLANLAALDKIGSSKVITTAGGKKVGVIGVTTPLLPSISSPPVGIMKNFSPTSSELQNLQALLPLVQAEINDLRNNQGVSVIIVMSHLQNSANELTVLIPGLTGVDMVISGGGHELMRDSDDPLINGGVAPSYNTHPVFANDFSGKAVPMVTGHFGNRYVGEVKLNLDDTTGAVTPVLPTAPNGVLATRMIRVSGNTVGFQPPGAAFVPADPDAVSGDPALQAAVITPVSNVIAALNAEIIGTTATKLNGPTHVACVASLPNPVPNPAPPLCPEYIEGVRNADTGLGNLVADAIRFAGGAEVAIQNGGGIRTNIAGPGNVSVGDTFNVLPFTNLVKTAPNMNATQLKDLMEHSVAASTRVGTPQGRFAQISGIQVTYDTTRTGRTTLGTGERIRRIVMDDGTVLVDNGTVISPRIFTFSTIDFTANGGDGYPFAANNVVFNNTVNTITYQEAFANFIKAPKAQGGLQRLSAEDGDEITVNMYGEENAFDKHGRLVDAAVALATPGITINDKPGRDTVVGTAGDDRINSGAGPDTLIGNAGGDVFVYRGIRDGGDTIVDFTPYADKLDLNAVLAKLGVAGDGVATGHISFSDTTGGVQVLLDTDGFDGREAPRTFITLKGLTAAQMAPGRDFATPIAP